MGPKSGHLKDLGLVQTPSLEVKDLVEASLLLQEKVWIQGESEKTHWLLLMIGECEPSTRIVRGLILNHKGIRASVFQCFSLNAEHVPTTSTMDVQPHSSTRSIVLFRSLSSGGTTSF